MGAASEQDQALVECAYRCLAAGAALVRPGTMYREVAAARQRPGEAAHLHRPVGAGGTHTVDISPSLPAHSESPALRAFTHGRASQWSLWSVLASLAIGRSRPHQLMSV